MTIFENIPWYEYLDEMKLVQKVIYYSPSLEIKNLNTKNRLEFSIVDEKQWYIFFKRPKMVKRFFGFSETMDTDYLSHITGQTIADVRQCL